MNELAKKVLAGDVRSVARVIRNIDDGIPSVKDVLIDLYPHTGRAYVIGITGAPGVGKSTLVDQMIAHLRKKNKTVGVLAVDPTSPFSGGAILGDRIRMQRHSLDEGVYIRSMATRGHFGGLTQSTRTAIDVLDAMGKDYILVETVGVGQDEVDIVKNAHTTVIVVIPGMGDDIQAIKAGILEVGDIFVINKSDREGSDKTLGDLKLMIAMDQKKHDEGGWKPEIIKAQAVFDKGIDDLLVEIDNHRDFIIKAKGDIHPRRQPKKVREELIEMIKIQIMTQIMNKLTRTGKFEKAVAMIVKGEIDPYTACEDLFSD